MDALAAALATIPNLPLAAAFLSSSALLAVALAIVLRRGGRP